MLDKAKLDQREKIGRLIDKKIHAILKFLDKEELCCLCHGEPMDFRLKFLTLIRDTVWIYQQTMGDLDEDDLRFILSRESEPEHTLH